MRWEWWVVNVHCISARLGSYRVEVDLWDIQDVSEDVYELLYELKTGLPDGDDSFAETGEAPCAPR